MQGKRKISGNPIKPNYLFAVRFPTIDGAPLVATLTSLLSGTRAFVKPSLRAFSISVSRVISLNLNVFESLTIIVKLSKTLRLREINTHI